jgi:hypothetical protein
MKSMCLFTKLIVTYSSNFQVNNIHIYDYHGSSKPLYIVHCISIFLDNIYICKHNHELKKRFIPCNLKNVLIQCNVPFIDPWGISRVSIESSKKSQWSNWLPHGNKIPLIHSSSKFASSKWPRNYKINW